MSRYLGNGLTEKFNMSCLHFQDGCCDVFQSFLVYFVRKCHLTMISNFVGGYYTWMWNSYVLVLMKLRAVIYFRTILIKISDHYIWQ